MTNDVNAAYLIITAEIAQSIHAVLQQKRLDAVADSSHANTRSAKSKIFSRILKSNMIRSLESHKVTGSIVRRLLSSAGKTLTFVPVIFDPRSLEDLGLFDIVRSKRREFPKFERVI